jgi:hypothetical protein
VTIPAVGTLELTPLTPTSDATGMPEPGTALVAAPVAAAVRHWTGGPLAVAPIDPALSDTAAHRCSPSRRPVTTTQLADADIGTP